MNYRKVKNIIFERKLNKKEIARRIGISYIWFAHYLNGNRDLTNEQEEILKEIIDG